MVELFLEYLEDGGLVMYVLLMVCFVFLHIGTGKFMLFRQYQMTRKYALGMGPKLSLDIGKLSADKAPDWFVKNYPGAATFPSVDTRDLTEEHIQEAMVFHVNRLEKGLTTMSAWISVAPLLGLLGTVIGMIATFKMITLYGVGDPSIMSEGISVALLTTQAGLMVAFPGLLLLSHLQNKKNNLVNELLSDSEELMKRRGKREGAKEKL